LDSIEWLDQYNPLYYKKIVSQSQPILDNIHLINLESHNRKLILDDNYPIDLTSYKITDLKKVNNLLKKGKTFEEILELVNSIDIIEIDGEFNIIDIYNTKEE
jgi:hypothetical protein